MDKKDCYGCYQDFYNTTTKDCFSFDYKKKLEKRYIVHVDQIPPFGKDQIRKVPPCYSPQRYAVVKLENIDSKGFWKY